MAYDRVKPTHIEGIKFVCWFIFWALLISLLVRFLVATFLLQFLKFGTTENNSSSSNKLKTDFLVRLFSAVVIFPTNKYIPYT
jgi:hypothetical protein